MKVSRKPDAYVTTAVSLGDRPAVTIATVALRKTADRDDASSLTCNIDGILKKGNFHIKGWTLSGCAEVDNEKPIMPEEWERVLGLVWLPSNDKFAFNVKISFSKKSKGIHKDPDISPENIVDKLPIHLTKRLILSQVNGIFDPLGLVSPFIVRAKNFLRRLWTLEPKLDWDDYLPTLHYEERAKFFYPST